MKLTEQNRKGPWVFSLNFPEFVWNSFLPRGDSPFIERLRSDCFQRVRNIAPISAHKKSTILLPGGICVCVCMWCAKFTEFVMISRCTMKKLTNSSVTCEVWNIWGDQTRWQVTSLISKSSDTLIYTKTKLTYTFHHISTFDLQSYYSKNLSWLWWTNDPQRVLVHLENLSQILRFWRGSDFCTLCCRKICKIGNINYFWCEFCVESQVWFLPSPIQVLRLKLPNLMALQVVVIPSAQWVKHKAVGRKKYESGEVRRETAVMWIKIVAIPEDVEVCESHTTHTHREYMRIWCWSVPIIQLVVLGWVGPPLVFFDDWECFWV